MVSNWFYGYLLTMHIAGNDIFRKWKSHWIISICVSCLRVKSYDSEKESNSPLLQLFHALWGHFCILALSCRLSMSITDHILSFPYGKNIVQNYELNWRENFIPTSPCNVNPVWIYLPSLLLCFIPSVDNMTEVSSLHDGLEPRGRGGRSQPPPLATVYDRDEAMSTISSVSQQGHRRDDYPRRGGGYMGDRVRARSMDNLDDIGRRHGRDDHPPHRRIDEPRGRRGWVFFPWSKPPYNHYLIDDWSAWLLYLFLCPLENCM